MRELDPRTAVSRRWRYVYLRVPKAANSSVVMSLTEHLPEDDPAMKEARHTVRKVAMTSFGELAPAEADLAGFFVFTFVRNPYHRVLSAFLDKLGEEPSLIEASESTHVRYRRFHGREIAALDGGRVTFLGFCRWLARGGERVNAHWMAQSRFLDLADRIDVIGRVERIDEDLPAILRQIAPDRPPPVVRRAGPPPRQATMRARDAYTPECRRLVEQVYAADFRRLGYALGDI
ncbi:MAG: sulfotransferase family protein [Sphingomonadaceae bacterium]|nr:sulfotransferase family protein [Sphingomonadaceae bacterium]